MAAKGGDFEKQLARLQAVVEQLEQGDVPLDKGVALYKEGLALAKACRGQLEKARHDIAVLSEGVFREFAAGEAGEVPGEETGDPGEEDAGKEDDDARG